jgi:sugar lactone lactonase YvrE
MAATAAQLNGPGGVAADAQGNVFVADTGDNEIRRVSSSGTITTVAGNGAQCTGLNTCGDGGPATSAKLSGPRGVAVDSAGNVYVADTGDNAIRMFTPGGSIRTIAGSGSQCTTSGNAEKPTCGDGGPATTASFNSPRGVAVDSAGNVLVADTLDHEIRTFAVGGSIAQIAGSGSQCTTAGNTEKPTCGDGGPATTAQLSAPEGVAVDSAHNVYVADTGDHEVREFAAGGTISTVAGNGTSCAAAGGTPKPTCGDGGAATSARLGSPSGVAVDSAGNVDIADTNDAEARRVTTGATISTIAGTGNVCAPTTSSCNDGSATNAQLNAPQGIGVGQGGLVYVGDTGDHKVRLLTPAAARNPARPLAIISSPSNAGTFTLNHAVALSFACREGAGGPGLQSCGVCETHPGVFSFPACTATGPSLAATVRLNTATLGIHTYTVTAVSRDGQTGTATLQYTVSRKRPLVYAPPAVLAQATQPCAMYRCRSNPALHTNYENSLTGQARDWCANYGCQHRMDLLPVNGFDDNLFPFNPDWAGFVLSGRRQPPFPIDECGQFPTANPSDWGAFCTTQQVSTDQGNHGSGYVCNMGRDPSSSFHGHVNWEPATYEGRLQWFEHSPGTDDDYSLDLHTFNLDGVTAANNGGNSIHIEFDSDETIDHFDDSEPWHSFHLAVDDESPQSAHYIDGDLAEVTGLVGVDAAHTPAAELHPVYAMAVQLDRNAALSGHNDEWMIFARNWGDEGYCSSHDHPIPAGPITVRIPWLNGARGVNLIAQPRPATGVKNVGSFFESMNTAHPAITERVLPGEGVLLTFDLSTDPSNEPEYWGHIYLKWTFTPHQLPVGGLPAGSPGNRAPTPAVHRPSVGDNDVEGVIAALIHRLSLNVRTTLLASIPPLHVITHRAKRVRIRMRPPPIAPLVKPGAFFLATLTDHAVLKRDSAQLRALCRAYRNRLPGFPGGCRPALRR